MSTTRTYRKVRVSWDSPEYAPVFTGYADGFVWGGGIGVWFAGEDAEALVAWQNAAHAKDPEGYPDHYTTSADGGYLLQSDGGYDDTIVDGIVPSVEIPGVGIAYALGDGWTWSEVEEEV